MPGYGTLSFIVTMVISFQFLFSSLNVGNDDEGPNKGGNLRRDFLRCGRFSPICAAD